MEEQIRISFFRHYTNAKQDEKIIQLLRKEQWQGYGIYWALLEFLTPIKDHKAKCEYDAIAWDLRVDEEIIKRIVNNYGLFVVKGGYFWSKSLTSQLDETAENIKRKKAAASRAGKSSAEKRKAASTNSNDSSTDVAENPTSVATDDGSPLINDIHDIHEIHEIDTRSVVSSSCEDVQRNSVSDNTPMQDEVSSVESRRRDFTCEVMDCEGDYPNDMRKEFAGYWTQSLQDNPQKMLFESKAAFDIPVRLAQWEKTEHVSKRPARPKKKEQVWTYNHYVSVYHTTEVKENWQTRINEATGEMEYYRPIKEE